MIVASLDAVVDAREFERRTGWAIKPEGACKGSLCVPLPRDGGADGEGATWGAVASRLGMPVVGGDDVGAFALGPATVGGGRALDTAALPDIVLPDVDGNPFRLSALHGRKAIVVAWASW